LEADMAKSDTIAILIGGQTVVEQALPKGGAKFLAQLVACNQDRKNQRKESKE
jgi:hypothetical protein